MSKDISEMTVEEIVNEMGKRLQTVREIYSISPVEMGEYLDITTDEYEGAEEGTFQLDCSHFFLLRFIFDIRLDWLIAGDGEMNFNNIILLNRDRQPGPNVEDN